MSVVIRAVAVLATAGALWLPTESRELITPKSTTERATATTVRRRPVAPPATPAALQYRADQIEFYLGDEGVAYIRPGLNIKVEKVEINADRKPVVELSITDDMKQPLDRLGQTTPGAISISFILAVYDEETRNYTAYTKRIATAPPGSPGAGAKATQATADSGGKWTDLERGRARYTFGTAIPADADMSKTHTIGIYATRNLNNIIGKNYYDNVEHDFIPAGGNVVHEWEVISDAACNACHEQLAFHGGSRRDVKLCVMCHSPQTSDPDTGNSVDMALMTHKIHAGANLEHGYTVIGYRQSVHDYSNVHFPQDLRNCETCHVGQNPKNAPADAHVFMTEPSRNACGSCHDDINWETGEGHPGGPATSDDACARCHIPDSGAEWDASIVGAHTIPSESDQLAGINAKIVSVTNVAAGQMPTITFKLTNNAGEAIDGSKLATFSPIHAGPTSSYDIYFRENGVGKATFDTAAGTTTYTFTNPIPEGATGTWAFSADIYRNASLKRADGKADITLREAALNPVHYEAITGSVTPRRTVVDMAKCNVCHEDLAFHGGQRKRIEECVMCHNPQTTDVARRPADQGAPESVSFQYLIHKIHRGADLEGNFTVFGFGNRPHNYNELHYPRDLRSCDACHVGNSHRLPVPATADAVIMPRGFFSPYGPAAASCLGCHDSRDAAAHAFLNTTTFGGGSFGEACGACHGEGSTWSVDKVHAR